MEREKDAAVARDARKEDRGELGHSCLTSNEARLRGSRISILRAKGVKKEAKNRK